MSGMHEEHVKEPEETRMARLHALLTKNRNPSVSPPPQKKKKNPRRLPLALKDSQPTTESQPRTQVVFDNTPPRTPSRTQHSIKPSHRLRLAEWRAVAMLQYHQKAIEIRSQQLSHEVDVFPFLALPPEIRTAVYFELLVTDDRVLPTWRGPRKATKQQKKMYINILLTCKICRDEGLSVLYGENIFDFGEICNRPNNFSKPFVKYIGLHNASLIRIVFAEYSAAAEELSKADTTSIEKPLQDLKPKATLTVAYLRNFLSTFNINLPNLRLLAISIMPYGHDQATDYLMGLSDAAIRRNVHLRVKWLDAKNEPKRLGQLVHDICARETGLAKADYWRDIDGWIGINFAPPSSGREWIVYQGVRGKEDTLVETKMSTECARSE